MNLVVIDKDAGTEYWTASQCAAFVEVRRDTFTSYASRGQAPQHAETFEGQRLWNADEVREWHGRRRRPSTQASDTV